MGTKLGTIICGQYEVSCITMRYKIALHALFCTQKKQGG